MTWPRSVSTASRAAIHDIYPMTRFSPRSALPPGVTVDPLPLLDTTWYEGGVRYWARRIGLGCILALSAVVYPIAIWAGALPVPDRIECQFTALREFALNGTDFTTHREQGSMIHRYIAWLNRHTSDPRLRAIVKRANVA